MDWLTDPSTVYGLIDRSIHPLMELFDRNKCLPTINNSQTFIDENLINEFEILTTQWYMAIFPWNKWISCEAPRMVPHTARITAEVSGCWSVAVGKHPAMFEGVGVRRLFIPPLTCPVACRVRVDTTVLGSLRCQVSFYIKQNQYVSLPRYSAAFTVRRHSILNKIIIQVYHGTRQPSL